jgi:hypothetical protein
MEHTIHTPSTSDVAVREPRPGLALTLALLSIPGSTLAWDLPAGGLWIGLPLALAAITVGLRARRDPGAHVRTGLATAAIVIASLVILQMVAWTTVSIVS